MMHLLKASPVRRVEQRRCCWSPSNPRVDFSLKINRLSSACGLVAVLAAVVRCPAVFSLFLWCSSSKLRNSLTLCARLWSESLCFVPRGRRSRHILKLVHLSLKSPGSLLSSELSPQKARRSQLLLLLLALSAVTAAAPWELILALDHFSSRQPRSSFIIQPSIFGPRGSSHLGDLDVCGAAAGGKASVMPSSIWVFNIRTYCCSNTCKLQRTGAFNEPPGPESPYLIIGFAFISVQTESFLCLGNDIMDFLLKQVTKQPVYRTL